MRPLLEIMSEVLSQLILVYLIILRRLYGRLSDQYNAGDFSYNTGKLRCPVCEGTGTISMDIQFLPDYGYTVSSRYRNDL